MSYAWNIYTLHLNMAITFVLYYISWTSLPELAVLLSLLSLLLSISGGVLDRRWFGCKEAHFAIHCSKSDLILLARRGVTSRFSKLKKKSCKDRYGCP